jgi:hypothetical protein
MGAYENPEAYIDTQSGQHYRNLQSTIAKTVTDIGESYYANQAVLKKEKEENQKMLKANDMKAQEYTFSLYTSLAKSGAGDTSVNWAKTFDPLISESVKLRTGLMNGTIPDKQGAVKRLAQIQASVDGVTTSLGNLSAAGTTYKTALEKGIGVEGGLSSWNDPKITSALDVMTQRLPGSKEPFFKDNDPNQLMWRVMDANGAILHEFNADELDKISRNQGLVKTVPSQIGAFDSLKVSNTNVFGVIPAKVGDKEAPIPNGRVTDGFLVTGEDGKPLAKEVVVSKIGNKTTSKLVYEVDATKIGATLGAGLQSQAEGMLADQSSAIDFYNDVISNEKGLYKGTGFNFDPRKPLDDAGKKKFVEDYKNYFVQTQIPKTQDVLKEDSSVVTNTVETKPEKEAKTAKGAKGVTANKHLQLEENAIRSKESAAQLSNPKDTAAVLSANGKSRISWDGGEKVWRVQTYSNGNWKYDIGQPAKHSKTEAAKLIGIERRPLTVSKK